MAHVHSQAIRVTAVLAPAATLVSMDAEPLTLEIERCLRVVDLFRRLGCEPTWRGEWRAV